MFHVPNHHRFKKEDHPLASTDRDGNDGMFIIQYGSREFIAMASDGMGWEHVSISSTRIPTWEEMCFFKEMFWDDEDCVIQYHPPKSEYVNNCKTALHLWRPTGQNIATPDSILVGFK